MKSGLKRSICRHCLAWSIISCSLTIKENLPPLKELQKFCCEHFCSLCLTEEQLKYISYAFVPSKCIHQTVNIKISCGFELFQCWMIKRKLLGSLGIISIFPIGIGHNLRRWKKYIMYWISIMCIPDICHFFTLAKFLENKIYTKKRQFFALNL